MRSSRHDLAVKVALRFGVLGLILGGWQYAARGGDPLGMPSPIQTFRAIGDLVADGSLIQGLWVTNQAMVVGYVVSLAISLPLGIAMGLVPWIRRVGEPYLTILLALPMISVIPIVQGVFGLGFMSRVVVIILFAFTYMTVNTIVGVRSVDERLKEMATSFRASRWQMLRRVILPGATPGIFAGARLGLGRALIGMVVAELLLVSPGVGSMILDYQSGFQPPYVFGILLVTVLEGVLLMECAGWLERRLLWWREAGRS